jgi:hypothetical protein
MKRGTHKPECSLFEAAPPREAPVDLEINQASTTSRRPEFLRDPQCGSSSEHYLTYYLPCLGILSPVPSLPNQVRP